MAKKKRPRKRNWNRQAGKKNPKAGCRLRRLAEWLEGWTYIDSKEG